MSTDKKFNAYLENMLQLNKNQDGNWGSHYAIIYKYFGQLDKANEMFMYLASLRMPSSKLDGLNEEQSKKIHLLVDTGHYQLICGIYLNMAHKDPGFARQCFEWSAENCHLSDQVLSQMLKDKWYDDIAVAYLWRSYALLILGVNDEANEDIKKVQYYFILHKKKGNEMWRTVEYALPRALLPLCEYKLDPTDQNRLKAKVGLDEYIKSIREYKDRLEGYLYYYHLKEAFPEVYGDNVIVPAGSGKTSVINAGHFSKASISPDFDGSDGSVLVCDDERGYLEVLGSQKDFEDYVKKACSIGSYPALCGLMDVYVADGREEPERLIKECERLLSMPGLGSGIKDKTEMILEVARYAMEIGSSVALYFDPEA